MQAVLISIGDELTLGQTVDTNTAWLAQQLARIGVPCVLHYTVADDFDRIVECFKHASEIGSLIIVSGGLGPTPDDLTREALAVAMGVELEPDPQGLAALQKFFEVRGKEMPERNRKQAMQPVGGEGIPNANGTAPGVYARLGKADVYLTPGVPREMKAMYTDSIAPKIIQANEASGNARVILTEVVHTFGMGESDVADQLEGLLDRHRNPTVGTTVSNGMCSVRIRSEGQDSQVVAAALADTLSQVEARLTPIAFGRGEQTLAAATLEACEKAGLSVAVAESCTGGLIGHLLTEVPGSSSVFRGGYIVYDNDLKRDALGVDADMLQAHGAVSPQVAQAMAQGALERSGSDLAVAVTGIAGPGGGRQGRPVGTVCFALADRRGQTYVRVAHLPGQRNAVRLRSALCALQWLRLAALGQSVDCLQWLKSPEIESTATR